MPQLSYTAKRRQVGEIVHVMPNARRSMSNPLRAQVSVVDIDGGTTDGNYRIAARDVLTGAIITHTAFAASGNSAAEIAAGVVSQWNAGVLSRPMALASVINTDQVQLAFVQSNRVFTVTVEEDASSGVDVLANSTEPGFDLVPAGAIIQGNGTGGFTLAYSDSTLALGVSFRGAKLTQSLENPTGDLGYKGGVDFPYADEGEISVAIAAGVSVFDGQRAFYNGSTRTWSNTTTGSHILVPGSRFVSSGADIQDVFFRLPSAA